MDLSGVSPDAKALADFMQEILDRVVNVYESFNMPIPARRYWTFGDPVVDCEQLVVSFVQAYIGSPGDEANEPRRCRDPRSATVNVRVSREVPVVSVNGRPPTAEDIEAFSEVIAYDSWILLEGAAALDPWDAAGVGLGFIATVDGEAPEGGFQTTRMTLTAAIP